MPEYANYGDFELLRTKKAKGSLVLDTSSEASRTLWETVENELEGLSDGVGYYIFGVKSGSSIKPWYVGQAKKGFKKECFTPDKKAKYLTAMNEVGKGKPVLILIVRLTPAKRLAKSLAKREAEFVERRLIGMALSRNPRLINVAGTKMYKDVRIPGILNDSSGKKGSGTKALQAALGKGLN